MNNRVCSKVIVGAMFALLSSTTIGCASSDDEPFVVGSKKFTENVVLGEILATMARSEEIKTSHKRELGGTRVVFNALLSGDIDAYVEYTGTIASDLLDDKSIAASNLEGISAALAKKGVLALAPLGFNNTYALALKRARAKELGLKKTSDLVGHPNLKFGFGNEFLERADGWPALRAAYGLEHQDVRGLDHDLAYRSVDDGNTDILEAYTTDAQIAALDLVLLNDDRNHFPAYRALVLVRRDATETRPALLAALNKLSGRIDVEKMGKMNKEAQIDREPEAVIAKRFVKDTFDITVAASSDDTRGLWHHTKDHLALVGISLWLAILFALPLGILAAKTSWLRQPVLAVVSILQTVPSLALLVFLIPFLGVGAGPAIVALFVYSLLPIVRNTVSGLDAIPPSLDESARALGLPAKTRLWKIELPLALPSILAGVKTAAVINVGTATLGAIIGAGGYGQPILTGIRLGSTPLILEGAIPAAVMALVVSAFFDGVERVLVSPGLRIKS